MKVFIVQFPFGILAFDEEKKLLEKTLFSKKPQVAAKTLLRIETGKRSILPADFHLKERKVKKLAAAIARNGRIGNMKRMNFVCQEPT